MNACLALGPHGPHVLRLSTTTPPTLGPCLVTDGICTPLEEEGLFLRAAQATSLSPPGLACLSSLPRASDPKGGPPCTRVPAFPTAAPPPVPHAPSPSSTPSSAEALAGWALLYAGLSQLLGITGLFTKLARGLFLIDFVCGALVLPQVGNHRLNPKPPLYK